jgi:hypothetical protein
MGTLKECWNNSIWTRFCPVIPIILARVGSGGLPIDRAHQDTSLHKILQLVIDVHLPSKDRGRTSKAKKLACSTRYLEKKNRKPKPKARSIRYSNIEQHAIHFFFSRVVYLIILFFPSGVV